MNKISILNKCADDLTAERAIIASNVHNDRLLETRMHSSRMRTARS